MSGFRATTLVLCRVIAAASLGACVSTYPQRLPGPLFLPPHAEPVPPDPRASSKQSVTVQRDSDPVWVRRPGERGDYGLPFYQKRERVPAGTLVRTGAGGRAEILWSPDASSLALFDEGRVTVGDPERDEPEIQFHSVTRALLVMTPEDRVELVGGAMLEGDSLNNTGPILVESVPLSILRVTNQSKLLVRIGFRSEQLELGPGESIDLPILANGAQPYEEETEAQRLTLLGFPLSISGHTEQAGGDGDVVVTALEPAKVNALGVAASLDQNETIRFTGLSRMEAIPPTNAGAKP